MRSAKAGTSEGLYGSRKSECHQHKHEKKGDDAKRESVNRQHREGRILNLEEPRRELEGKQIARRRREGNVCDRRDRTEFTETNEEQNLLII
jgi:hypothetical protein